MLTIDDWFAEPEIALSKLDDAEWRSWQGREQRAMEAYLRALWRSMLGDFPTRIPAQPGAEAILCAIAQDEDELGPCLIDWQEACATSSPALRCLAAFTVDSSCYIC